MKKTIAVLAGDGIGPEVMTQALKVLKKVESKFDIALETQEVLVGGAAYDKTGDALPKETLDACEQSDAILFGSVGGPQWDNLPSEKRVETNSLLKLRKHFDLFANLRPAVLYPSLAALSPLKNVEKGFDILVVRELSSGIYFGKKTLSDTEATDEMYYSKKEIERIAHTAFHAAQKRNNKVTCVDKANVLSTSVLWRKTVDEVKQHYPSVALDYLYIDNATMQVIKRPQDFDVVLTSNMFGDIFSDLTAEATGSIGLLPSASLNEKNFGMYEPSGGSAPDIAGKNVANPIAQIMSAAMMFKYSFERQDIHDAIEKAVQTVLEHGNGTADIAKENSLTTDQMGDKIAELI